jgi:hypothetical protein
MNDWPPYSPDMNLIENIWAHLKLELHRRYPDTATLRGSPQCIRQCITERVHEVWWSIGEELLDHLKILVPECHRVKPAVVLAIIQALPRLREIEIWLCVGGGESGQIGSNATCLATNFEDNLPVLASHDHSEDKNLLHYILTVVRNGAAIWTVRVSEATCIG